MPWNKKKNAGCWGRQLNNKIENAILFPVGLFHLSQTWQLENNSRFVKGSSPRWNRDFLTFIPCCLSYTFLNLFTAFLYKRAELSTHTTSWMYCCLSHQSRSIAKRSSPKTFLLLRWARCDIHTQLSIIKEYVLRTLMVRHERQKKVETETTCQWCSTIHFTSF